MRSSGGRPYLRRVVRSVSSPSRDMPICGVKSKLLRKVPLSTRLTSSPVARKPRCQRRMVKLRLVVAPGATLKMNDKAMMYRIYLFARHDKHKKNEKQDHKPHMQI